MTEELRIQTRFSGSKMPCTILGVLKNVSNMVWCEYPLLSRAMTRNVIDTFDLDQPEVRNEAEAQALEGVHWERGSAGAPVVPRYQIADRSRVDALRERLLGVKKPVEEPAIVEARVNRLKSMMRR